MKPLKKFINRESYPIGIPSVLIAILLLGAVILFFLGICGEYLLSINERSMKRPLVVISEKINF